MTALTQGSKEWLEFRKKKIGGSDAPIIMQKSPWSTPFKLWCEKLSLVPEKEKTARMQNGLDLEPQARKEFERLSGHIVFPQVLVSKEYDFMMASFDGLDIEQKHAVEIKCPGKVDHESAMDGVVPEKYMPQLQHQMIVAKLEMIFYFSYDENSSKIIEVERNDVYAKKIISEEQKFIRYMENFESPPLTDKDYVARSDREWIENARRWLKVNKQIKELEAEEEEARKSLIMLSNQTNAAGGGVRLMKVMRKGVVDYKAVPSLKEIDLEKYRKAPSESWRLISI